MARVCLLSECVRHRQAVSVGSETCNALPVEFYKNSIFVRRVDIDVNNGVSVVDFFYFICYFMSIIIKFIIFIIYLVLKFMR